MHFAEIKNSQSIQNSTAPFSGASSELVLNILELNPEYIKSIRKDIVKQYGEPTFELLLQKHIWNANKLISFEDFREFPTVRNNFYLFFVEESFIGNIVRTQQFYIDFQTQNPELDARLRKQFSSGSPFENQFCTDLTDLYQAYRLMFSLDGVGSNRMILQ